MNMNDKVKECFKPHALMHSLFGLGLGITLVALIPSLSILWLGILLIAVAAFLDYTRKS